MKKLSAALFALFSCLMITVCAHAAAPAPVKTVLDTANAYQPYSFQIQMQEGQPSDYTFELTGFGIMPSGITVSDSGLVSGTPTSSGGFSGMYVRITRKETGESEVYPFSLVIQPRRIKVTISDTQYTYEKDTPRKATVTCYDMEDNLLNDINPTVSYGFSALEEANNAGTYYINLQAPSGCRIEEIDGPEYLVVSKQQVSSITISPDSQTATYNAHPHAITGVTTEPANISYTVEYKRSDEGSYTTDVPSAAGVYSVRAYTSDPNYQTVYSNIATLSIEANGIDFKVENNVYTYDGTGHNATVSSDEVAPEEYDVKYVDGNGTEYTTDNPPVDAGTYYILIDFKTEGYSMGNIDPMTINPAAITFTADSTSWQYDAAAHTPVKAASTSPAGLDTTNAYTVKYIKNGSTNETDSVKDAGTYSVEITITDTNFIKADGAPESITVDKALITFGADITSWQYDGAQHEPVTVQSALPDGISTDGMYTITYRKGGSGTSKVKDAGVYSVEIKPNANFEVAAGAPNEIEVTKAKLSFSADRTQWDYDGVAYKPVTLESTTPAGLDTTNAYTVYYHKDGSAAPLTEVRDAGVYSVDIDVSSGNFEVAAGAPDTITVNAVAQLNMGNSPAAMIYMDAGHDTEWQAQALADLQTNRQFSVNYCPAGADPSVKYNLINGVDVDADVNTVIVDSLEHFIDPGLAVQDGTTTAPIMGAAPVPYGGIDGLYTVSYTYEGDVYTRYVMVINGKLGDANEDGRINALDANYLDRLDRAPENVREARIWDINKDNILDRNDGQFIRRRFDPAYEFVPYYPWL